jgi:serine/threonine protein phosphatase PrpC
MNVTTSTFLERGNQELQDRIEILRCGDKIVCVVADGVGGRSGAAQAAEFVVRSACENASRLNGPEDCFGLLCDLDQKITQDCDCGETTGVIAVVTPGELFGANVGDSAAWLFTPDGEVELTRVRKPYLGTGVAAPHQFTRKVNGGTVVVASDGLWKYTSVQLIGQSVRTGDSALLAGELGNLVRLRSGAFPDDVAIATCRIET